jgi:hypothetical protein
MECPHPLPLEKEWHEVIRDKKKVIIIIINIMVIRMTTSPSWADLSAGHWHSFPFPAKSER